jgi:hypothetical protein
METFRPDPFQPGRSYRVRKDFKAFRDDFKEGEILVYQKNGYSIYDNMSGFFFHDSGQKWRSWDIHDGEPIEVWPELFELIP